MVVVVMDFLVFSLNVFGDGTPYMTCRGDQSFEVQIKSVSSSLQEFFRFVGKRAVTRLCRVPVRIWAVRS